MGRPHSTQTTLSGILPFVPGRLLQIAFNSMASGNPFFDDIRTKTEVDPPQNEEATDVSELVNDPALTALKPNGTVSNRLYMYL
ncbi:hypothetical protein HN51_020133 [Arachis hypogaea]